MSHFYVTLPSDSSRITYPENTVAHYVTKLARPIHLDGDYEVALTELIYPHCFNQVDIDELEFSFVAHVGKDLIVLAKVTIPNGYYANETEFAEKVGEFVSNRLQEDVTDRSITFSMKFNTVSRNLSMEFDGPRGLVLWLKGKSAKKMGFKPGYLECGYHESDMVFDLNAGLRLMYIYSDIGSYSFVGDIETPLLRVCNVSGEFGEMQRVGFTQLNYIPVAHKHFDTIEININNEIGRPMPFAFGKSLVILHFRRRYNLP